MFQKSQAVPYQTTFTDWQGINRAGYLNANSTVNDVRDAPDWMKALYPEFNITDDVGNVIGWNPGNFVSETGEGLPDFSGLSATARADQLQRVNAAGGDMAIGLDQNALLQQYREAYADKFPGAYQPDANGNMIAVRHVGGDVLGDTLLTIGSVLVGGLASTMFSAPAAGATAGGAEAAGAAGAFDAAGMGTGIDAGVMASDAGLASMAAGGAGALATAGGTTTGAGAMGDIFKGGANGVVNAGLSLLSGLQGLESANDIRNSGPGIYDPFAAERKKYQDQLALLASDPNYLTSLPGYQAGLQAVMRSGAANGYLGSGNMMAALQQYGGNVYQQEFQRLATLAGANIGPMTDTSALQNNVAAGDMTSRAWATFGNLASKIDWSKIFS